MQRPGADREPIQSAARIVLVSASSVPSPWPDLGGTERIDRLSKTLSCQKISRKLGAADVLLAFGHPKSTYYGEKPNYFKQIRSCRGPSGFWTPKNHVLWRETKTIMKRGAVRCQTKLFFLVHAHLGAHFSGASRPIRVTTRNDGSCFNRAESLADGANSSRKRCSRQEPTPRAVNVLISSKLPRKISSTQNLAATQAL